MSEEKKQSVEVTEEQVNLWQRECLGNAQKFLAERGVLPVSVLDKESCFIHPLCAIWKIKGNDGNTYWVLTGRLPTDAVQASAAENARDVLRHFSFQWQLKADSIMENKAIDKTQLDFANLLVSRAHGLYELYQKDDLWANAAS